MTLKLDGRTVRGKKWKEISNCGKPLKQGVLLPTKSCSFCNEFPDAEKETIECMCCHSYFHISCLIKPVSEEFLDLAASNPCVWWYCLGCMSSKTSDSNSISNCEYLADGSMPTDIVLTNTLLSFKSDILTLVSETMENKFKTLSGLLDKKKNVNSDTDIIQNEVQIAPKTLDVPLPRSKSSPWNNFQTNSGKTLGPIDSSSNVSHYPKGNEKDYANKTEKHVLLLQPTSTDVMGSETAQKSSLSSINHAMSGMNVNFCSIKKSGVVAIGFKDSKTKMLAEEKINQNKKLSSDFQAKSPKKLMPKVTIKGINEVLFEDCIGDRDQMKDVLRQDIVNRNQNIKDILETDSSEFLTVVMVQKTMPSHSSVSYIAAIKMSCRVRKAIFDNDDKLYISLKRCKVFDRYYVKQCYHCQEPGHTSNDCPSKKENKTPTCFYCSGSHFSKNCDVKNNVDEQCCSNCLKSNKPEMVEGARNHTSASLKCPILQSYRNSIKAKTENWCEKNLVV